jgi:hypothetical protein
MVEQDKQTVFKWYKSSFGKWMVAAPILAFAFSMIVVSCIEQGRVGCDRAASADISKLTACLERLFNEIQVDLNCDLELSDIISNENIAYFVGPYYGWGGTNLRCRVRLRVKDKEVWSCSKLGSLPTGNKNDRVIFRTALDDLRDLPITSAPCEGKRYGYPVYISSMIDEKECAVKEPDKAPEYPFRD